MQETMDSLKEIVKGSSIVLLGIILSKILGYAYRLLIARIGPEQYGLLSLGLSITGILTTIALLGLNLGIGRYVPFFIGKKDEKNVAFTIKESLKIACVSSIFLSSIVFIFSKNISIYFFNTESLIPVLRIMSFSIFLGTINVIFYDIMISFQRIKYHVVMKNIFENVIKIILVLILVYFLSYGVNGAALGYIASMTIASLVSFVLIRKYIFNFLKLENYKDQNLRREIISYSIPLMFSGILISLISWTDTLMIGYFRGPTEVGIYNAALPTAQLIYIIPYTLTVIFLPVITKLYARRETGVLEVIYKRVTKWIIFINFLLFSFLFLFSAPIINILFGRGYSGAIYPLLILSAGFFIGYLLLPTEKIFMILKKTKLIFFITLTTTVLNIILNYFLIPFYGVTGAALSTAISHVFIFLFYAIKGYFIIKVNPFKTKYFIIISLFLIELVLIKRFFDHEILKLLAFFILFAILTLITLVLAKVFEKEDIILIKMILNKIKTKM